MHLALSVALCLTLCAPDDRGQLPGVFHGSYIGLTAGFGAFSFTDAYLTPGLHSTRITNDRATVQVSVGHYFTPHLALQLSLMRPILWVQYRGVYASNSSNSVSPSVLALTVRPTLPLNDRFRLYGDVGAAYVSWIGFTGPGGTAGVTSAGLVAPLTGVGVLYRLSQHWNLDAGVSATWPGNRAHQPATRYGALGFEYVFGASAPRSREGLSVYEWPLQVLQVGFFEKQLFYWDATRIVSTRSAPLFFNGEIKTRSGYTLMYERNVFHTAYWIALDWGVSVGRWVSAVNGEEFFTASVYPAIRVFPIHSSLIDVYLTYSIAGPSYISRNVIDGKRAGGGFTFQDYIGVGALLGKGKHFSLSLKLMHYSNGNLFAHNPGVAPPLTLNVGYAWCCSVAGSR